MMHHDCMGVDCCQSDGAAPAVLVQDTDVAIRHHLRRGVPAIAIERTVGAHKFSSIKGGKSTHVPGAATNTPLLYQMIPC